MESTSLENPQTLNLYAYCSNDPVNYTDPSGLGFFSFLRKAFKWIGIALSIAIIAVSIVGLAVIAPALSAIGFSSYASAVTAASISGLVTGGLGLASQIGPRPVRIIAGLALLGLNVYGAVQSLTGSRGFGFGLQEPVFLPEDTIRVSTWARGPWWDKLANPGLLSLIGSFAGRTAKALIKNELKVWRCFESNRFSAAVSHFTQGSRFHGAATFAAQSAEIIPPLLVASDVPAIAAKGARSGIGGPKTDYASGINWVIRKTFKGTIKGTLEKGVSRYVTPGYAGAAAFTTGYNAVQGWACRFGLQQ